MATRLTPVGVVTKWVLVPALLAGFGFFFVGPKVGDGILGSSKLKNLKVAGKSAASSESTTSSDSSPDSTAQAASGNDRGPQVDVTVVPPRAEPSMRVVVDRSERPKRKKKEPKQPQAAKKEEPKVETPPAEPPTPPVDEGGSGGAATAGGTGFDPNQGRDPGQNSDTDTSNSAGVTG